MLNTSVLKDVLHVKHAVIEDMVLNEGILRIRLHPTKHYQCRCPICGRKCPKYDRGRSSCSWRAGDCNTAKVYFVADHPRVCCPRHGVRSAQVPWARQNSNFTYDFEHTVAWMARNVSKKAAAEFMRISWRTVGDIISRVKDELDPRPERRLDGLVRIGVDETSYKKGHKYLTVVVNHDTGKVVWVHVGFGKEVFSKFFREMTEEQRASIKVVSGDGAKWIDECMDEFCPQAERCVDPFHVVEWASDMMDAVRRGAWNDARKELDKAQRTKGTDPSVLKDLDSKVQAFKNARYATLKGITKLDKRGIETMRLLVETSAAVSTAYLYKELLRMLMEAKPKDFERLLDCWIQKASMSAAAAKLEELSELVGKVRRHRAGILNSVVHGLSNARLEATNNKIKLTIRMAYGFRNMQNMLDMIMLRCSDIPILLPWEYPVAA